MNSLRGPFIALPLWTTEDSKERFFLQWVTKTKSFMLFFLPAWLLMTVTH